jgi:tetratricopeptide (TPR) repeat protein
MGGRVRGMLRLAAVVAAATTAFAVAALFVRTTLWSTLAGIITALTAVLAALTALVAWAPVDRSPEHSVSELDVLKGEYLRKWIALERLMRDKLAASANDEYYQTASLSRIIRLYSQALGNRPDKESELLRNLGLRNQIVHASSEAISAKELRDAIVGLNDLLASVKAEQASELGEAVSDAGAATVRGEEYEEYEEAAYQLGRNLAGRGDIEAARAALLQAIDSGHADIAPRALLTLGVLLQQQGDLDGARAALLQAIDSGHADIAPRALLTLGVLLQQEGDLTGARAAFQQALASGDVDAGPRAVFNLGILLQQQGDLDGARAAFQQAIDSGEPTVSPAAALLRDTMLGHSRTKSTQVNPSQS